MKKTKEVPWSSESGMKARVRAVLVSVRCMTDLDI